MTDKRQSDALRIAALLEKTGAQGSLRDQAAAELRRQHIELETLRTGYEAARLEIESLKAQPVGAVPVARLEIGKTKGGVSLTHIAEPAAFQLPEGMYALYTTPQPTQAQAGAVPLTAYQIHEAIKAFKDSENLMGVNHIHIARAIEHAHGIKGGQHG